jgi:ribosomal protein S18 acetylase RimI-like enzyme
MGKFLIRDYIPSDNQAVLRLEKRCPQGKELQISFHRRSFHKRSEMYSDYAILVGLYEGKLVSVVAGAVKEILIDGKKIRAGYFYDLRVDPDYRSLRTKIARKMCMHIAERISLKADLVYCMIAARNLRALHLIKRYYEAKVIIPFKFLVNPVYKKRRTRGLIEVVHFEEAHERFLGHNPNRDFYCSPNLKGLLGYVRSYRLESSSGEAGCSIWSNKEILGERIENVPKKYEKIRSVLKVASLFMKTPHIPEKGESLDSWHLFDFYASTPASARKLFLHINNAALQHNKTYIHLPIQESEDFFPVLKKCCWKFSPVVDYFVLANGKELPRKNAKIYIDIRDL